jgi:hypothetical protein
MALQAAAIPRVGPRRTILWRLLQQMHPLDRPTTRPPTGSSRPFVAVARDVLSREHAPRWRILSCGEASDCTLFGNAHHDVTVSASYVFSASSVCSNSCASKRSDGACRTSCTVVIRCHNRQGTWLHTFVQPCTDEGANLHKQGKTAARESRVARRNSARLQWSPARSQRYETSLSCSYRWPSCGPRWYVFA